MALVNITNVTVLDNPTHYTNPFQFEITFECLEALQDDLEWKLIYVGSAYDQQKDQELESILVGPIPVGLNKIVFQTDAPDINLIDRKEILGPTVILLTCSYLEQEFIRIGYYVNNEYESVEMNENPPDVVDISKVVRAILAESPRVTRFDIKWAADAGGMMEEETSREPAMGGETAAMGGEAAMEGGGFQQESGQEMEMTA